MYTFELSKQFLTNDEKLVFGPIIYIIRVWMNTSGKSLNAYLNPLYQEIFHLS